MSILQVIRDLQPIPRLRNDRPKIRAGIRKTRFAVLHPTETGQLTIFGGPVGLPYRLERWLNSDHVKLTSARVRFRCSVSARA